MPQPILRVIYCAACVAACVLVPAASAQEATQKSGEVRSTPGDSQNPSTDVGRVRALIVGIDEYQNQNIRRLRLAVKDARAMRDRVLSRMPGSRLQSIAALLENGEATKSRILAALESLSQAHANDTVLVYFSGHGLQSGNQGFLVPYDTDPWDIEGSALAVSAMLGKVTRIPAERVFVILDTCYSGTAAGANWAGGARTFTFGPTTRSAIPLSKDIYETVKARRGHFVLAASEADQEALEFHELGHGLFTYFLLQGLDGAAARPGNSYVTVFDLHEYVAKHVQTFARALKQKQTPKISGASAGESPIITTDPKGARPPSVSSLAALIEKARVSYESARLIVTANGSDRIELYIGRELRASWNERSREERIPKELFDRHGNELQLRLVAIPATEDRKRQEVTFPLRKGDEKTLAIESVPAASVRRGRVAPPMP